MLGQQRAQVSPNDLFLWSLDAEVGAVEAAVSEPGTGRVVT
jgi:hypothetical protein